MQLPADSAKDAAIVSFSNQLMEDDPQDACQWAESIGNSDQRQSTVINLFSRWMQTDPASASAAVQSSNLSVDQKNNLLQRAAH